MARSMSPQVAERRRRWRHPCLWRVAAAAVGVGLVGLAELTCRLAGWGEPDWRADPFVSFRPGQPLYVPEGASGWMTTSPGRRRFFLEQRFERRKPPGTFRIFCLGGSTVQGNPYGPETAFPRWLELALGTVAPGRRWQVINVGGLSYASYRLVLVLAECLQWEPDLIVLATGHNEFLEDRSYGRIRRLPDWAASLTSRAARLRLFQVMEQALRWGRRFVHRHGSEDTRPIMPAEVDALLDYRHGIKAYHRDPAWHAGVRAHFGVNLRRMAALCREAGVPLVWVVLPSNLRDCPPFKSEPTPGLSTESRKARDRLAQEARMRLVAEDPAGAVERLQEAVRLDPEDADLYFELGRAQAAVGDLTAAASSWRRARDLDVCPLRMTSPLEATLRQLARKEAVPLVDWAGLIAARSPGGAPGDDWLVDHVHPKPEGHQLLAEALLRWMAARGWLALGRGWRERVRQNWRKHLAGLRDDYWAEGERALAGLRAWTRGEVSGPPIEYRLLWRENQRLSGIL